MCVSNKNDKLNCRFNFLHHGKSELGLAALKKNPEQPEAHTAHLFIFVIYLFRFCGDLI